MLAASVNNGACPTMSAAPLGCADIVLRGWRQTSLLRFAQPQDVVHDCCTLLYVRRTTAKYGASLDESGNLVDPGACLARAAAYVDCVLAVP